MRIITFSSKVDDDVIKKYNLYNSDERQFDFYIMSYLNSPDGWSQYGYFFEQKEYGYITIRLSLPKTIENICGLVNLSCAELRGTKIYLNSDKWFYGSKESKLSLEDYRQYMVSHEIGHILGYDHKKCPCRGCKAPIMMQQTLGIKECKPNTKV